MDRSRAAPSADGGHGSNCDRFGPSIEDPHPFPITGELTCQCKSLPVRIPAVRILGRLVERMITPKLAHGSRASVARLPPSRAQRSRIPDGSAHRPADREDSHWSWPASRGARAHPSHQLLQMPRRERHGEFTSQLTKLLQRRALLAWLTGKCPSSRYTFGRRASHCSTSDWHCTSTWSASRPSPWLCISSTSQQQTQLPVVPQAHMQIPTQRRQTSVS